MKKQVKMIAVIPILYCIVLFNSCSKDSTASPEPKARPAPTPVPIAIEKRETFTFSSNGKSIRGKIFVPGEYEKNKNLPAIYLIDFTEQHFQVITDEFDKVIEGVKAVNGLNALVITFEEHMDIDYGIQRDYQEYSEVFKDMASYVDDHYTGNTSRTFIGRGSEAGYVLMTLFLEEKETSVFQNFIASDSPSVGEVIQLIKNEAFPQEKENKKLHYSFSSTNDYDLNGEMINIINKQAYPLLEFESVEYPNLIY